MAEPKGGRLEDVANARMYVLLVALVRWQRGAQEGGKVLVDYHILKTGNHRVACPLIDILIAPIRMHPLDSLGQGVVPTQKENGEGEDRRVLIGSRITKNWKQMEIFYMALLL